MERSRHALFHYVVAHPVGVLMLFIGVAVFGWVSYARLPLNLMPDISYPSVTVRTEVPGAAPEEVEEQVSRPIEEALATVQGLVELESRSRAELSDVILEFGWGTDIDQATQDVRERLQTTWLPDDAARPLILRYDPSLEPILRLALSTESEEDWRAREEYEREEARKKAEKSKREAGLAALLGGPRAPAEADAEAEAPLSEYRPATLFQLRELCEREIKPVLEAMDGVAAARVRGGLTREIRVEVREDWLAARGVTLEQIQAALVAQNVNVSGGSIREGDTEYLIRTLNQFTTVDELRDAEIVRPDGARVRLADVAAVREAHKDREVLSLLDGRPAVEIEIHREADANIVQVARAVKERLGIGREPPPELPADLPPEAKAALLGPPSLIDSLPDGVILRVQDDQAAFIEAALDNLFGTVKLGAILAIAILFLFLRNFRATLVISAAIPVSLVVAFAPMYLGGVSLNLMSLGGLALGVGMLVDNAVVVLESIQTLRDRGVPRVEAAIRGTGEVAAAVTSSTLTTVAVFFPIAFVGGVAGQVFGDLAMAVVFSLLASLAMALFLVPVAAALQLPATVTAATTLDGLSPALSFPSIGAFRVAWRSVAGWRRALRAYHVVRLVAALGCDLFLAISMVLAAFAGRAGVWLSRRALPWAGGLLLGLAGAFGRRYDRGAERYVAWLGRALDRPGTVLGLATLVFLASLGLMPALGVELIPEVHQGRFTVELALPVGTPLERTEQVVARAEALIADLPDVAGRHAIVGTERQADSEPDEGEHTARISVQLAPGGDLEDREAAAMERVRAALLALPDTEVVIRRPALFSFQTPVEVVIAGQDLPELHRLAGEAEARLAGVPGLTDVQSSLVRGFPEVRIRYRRALLAQFGLDPAAVARAVRNKVLGADARELAEGERRVDMVVRLDERDRAAVEQLDRLNVNPRLTPPITLGTVADLEEAEGPSEIRRVNQQRVAVVLANLEGFDLAGTGARVRERMAGMTWPDGYGFTLAGQSREMQDSMRDLRFALWLSIFLVYAIMAATFENLLHPLVILFSLPLAVVGVTLTLAPPGIPISVVAVIGVIVLAGVVVNNAIVLVDAVNQRRRLGGQALREAVVASARTRLRPILVTTTTTVLGLLPLSLGFGEGAEIQRPLAVTVMAGISSATLLTLVVIPVLYERVSMAWERRFGRPDTEPPLPGDDA